MTWGGVAEVERSGSTRLERWSGAGWTTLRVRTTPHASIGWVVVGAYTSRAELRQVVSVENRDITIAALAYYHDPDEIVLALDAPTLNVRWFGAMGDGTTDDTAAIQAAIDAANALYGSYKNVTNVYFPYAPSGYLVTSVTLKSGVNLYSPSYLGSTGAYLKSTTAGWVIDTTADDIVHAGVDGVGVIGGGTLATNGMGGIRLQDADRCWIKNTFLEGFANQAILVSNGTASEFSKILAYNSLMDRSRAAVAGVVEIYGSDHLMDYIEAGALSVTYGSVTDANLYCVGILVGQSTGFIRDCVGEISDVGIYVSGGYNHFSNCRADLNYGHGWMIAAGAGTNRYTGCFALSNSQDTTNTYDGFHVVGTNGNNSLFTGCHAFSVTAKKHRYGFYDDTQSVAIKNRYVNCYSITHATGEAYLSTNHASSFEIAQSLRGADFTDQDATPSVAGATWFKFTYTVATTVTNFDDGIEGQIIRIQSTGVAPNMTITHGTNIFATSGSDITVARYIVYSFQKLAGKWYQI